MEGMEEILKGLQHMRTANPEAFKQAMLSLGLPVEENNGSIVDDSASLSKMAEAIKQMRVGESQNGGEGAIGAGVHMGKRAPTQPKGISIVPTPGFAFKTTRVSDKMKVFVNMASHEAIDEPAIKKKLDDKGEEVEGMNIPMSVGPLIWGEDNKGAKCMVYDIIVNPIVITEAAADKTGKYRDFICQLGMQYLEQKYKEELDKRYKLPKLKYLGETVAAQLIQDRKSVPKIQEVSSSSHSESMKGKAAAAKAAQKVVAEVPDKEMVYTVQWLQAAEGAVAQSAAALARRFSASNRRDSAESASDQWQLLPYEQQTIEYLDPIHEPEKSVAAILLTTEVGSYDLQMSELKVHISPYKVTVKAPGYRKVTAHLACAVKPAESYYTLRRPYEGCVSAVSLQLVLVVDHADWAEEADAGSKTWLLMQALGADSADGGDGTGGNPYLPGGGGKSGKSGASSMGDAVSSKEGDHFAEDKFHLNLPEDVDQYTGVKLDGTEEPPDMPLTERGGGAVAKKAAPAAAAKSGAKPVVKTAVPEEETEFAEDRFHRKDASSSYLINQREQARKDKWDKHEKEKAERANDPNVEYVDMEDFRPGGKYGPAGSTTATQAALAEGAQNEELRRAAEVVATAQEGGLKLSSTLWTELLD